MRDELVALEGLMEEPGELQTCHRDLWADNVLRTTAGGLCVIDWENCGLADPSQELALVLFEFGLGDPRRARALYRAYLEAGGPGRIDRRGNFSMLIAQLGHIGEDACTRWLDPGPRGRRERHEARAEQFIRWLNPGESEAERKHQEARVEEFVKLPLHGKRSTGCSPPQPSDALRAGVKQDPFLSDATTVMKDRRGRFGRTGRVIGVLVVPVVILAMVGMLLLLEARAASARSRYADIVLAEIRVSHLHTTILEQIARGRLPNEVSDAEVATRSSQATASIDSLGGASTRDDFAVYLDAVNRVLELRRAGLSAAAADVGAFRSFRRSTSSKRISMPSGPSWNNARTTPGCGGSGAPS